MAFSREWTDEERLKVILLIASVIQDDIPAGRYGQIGRPNMQSIIELGALPAQDLERQRESIESFVRETLVKRDETEVQFYGTPLAEQRETLEETFRANWVPRR
jgi:hypothetical protein